MNTKEEHVEQILKIRDAIAADETGQLGHAFDRLMQQTRPAPGVMYAGGDPQLDRIEATLGRIEAMLTGESKPSTAPFPKTKRWEGPFTLAGGDTVTRDGVKGHVNLNTGTGFVVQWDEHVRDPRQQPLPTEYEDGGYPWGFDGIELGDA